MNQMNNSNKTLIEAESEAIAPNRCYGLFLPLQLKWFELTKSKIKLEDYREITPYWCARLLLWNGSKVSQKHWERRLHDNADKTMSETILDYINSGFCEFQDFQTNVMTLGYPKRNDSSRILNLEHNGIEIRTGNKDWGAKPNEIYFVILHGSVLE